MAKETVSPADSDPTPGSAPYLVRVFSNDSLKKGVAAALAGLLVAGITEAIWPSE